MKLEKYLSEGRNALVTFADRKDLVILADNITRLIAGDKKVWNQVNTTLNIKNCMIQY